MDDRGVAHLYFQPYWDEQFELFRDPDFFQRLKITAVRDSINKSRDFGRIGRIGVSNEFLPIIIRERNLEGIIWKWKWNLDELLHGMEAISWKEDRLEGEEGKKWRLAIKGRGRRVLARVELALSPYAVFPDWQRYRKRGHSAFRGWLRGTRSSLPWQRKAARAAGVPPHPLTPKT